jgi:hypothetical protein
MTYILFHKISEMFSIRFKTLNPRLRSSCEQAIERDAGLPGESMKILPRKAQLAEQSTQQEDTTTEFETGAEGMGHRRIAVTIERETLSFLTRRPVEASPDPQQDTDSNPDRTQIQAGRELK